MDQGNGAKSCLWFLDGVVRARVFGGWGYFFACNFCSLWQEKERDGTSKVLSQT